MSQSSEATLKRYFARTPSHPRELDWSDLLSVPGDYLTSTSIPPHVERVRPIHRMDPKDVRAWYNYILHGQASEKPSFAFVFEVQDSAGEEAGGESGKNTADAGAVAGEGSDGEPDDSVAGLSGDNEAADDENNGDDVDMEAEDEADGDEVDVERGASRKRKTSASISEEHAVDEDPQPAAKKPRETGPELAQSSKGRQTSGKGKRKASEPQLSDDISEPEEAPASAALKTGGRGKAKKAPPAAPSKK
ncbi:hypothetical protein BOTBODRAFT_299129 [Botryobasidium botryosum FD-172 SS1]|uniref:Uncharacterized protein n=1 Tax=Botryobasidium botryosum (strain FD-172 SS1) TaxID=930990 RepID=A0A067LR99_BOTB1|nr:hypothetical protein BOTBODRAFT_299129 [Botryobasidium botryosum FD-172 SS1]